MDWKTAKLGELAKINYGYTAKASFEINGPKFLRITDIQDGIVNWSSVPSCELSDQDFIKHKLETNDIVFARTGATTGKSFLIKEIENSVAASYLIRLRLTSSEILPEFVYVFFQTSKYWELVEAGSTGSAQGGFNASKLSNLEINFPPVSEQKRIVALLDTVFADLEQTRAKTEQNLKNARELFDSYLQQVFSQKGKGWIESTLNDTCSLITCGVAATPKYVDKEEGIPFLSAQNVKKSKIDLSKYRYISKEHHANLTKKNKPQNGDLLYSRVGAGFGEAAVIELDFEFSVYVSVTLIKPIKEKINSHFLKWFLNSPETKAVAKASISSSGVPNLNVKSVRSFFISYPYLEEQEKIVNQIELVNGLNLKIQDIYTEKLEAIDELKKSILQKAFSGELTTTTK